MPRLHYEISNDTLLDEVEMWFIANCSPDKYDTIEQYIDDMDSFVDCLNNAGIISCVDFLVDEYGYSPEYVMNRINEIAAYIVNCAENSLRENLN